MKLYRETYTTEYLKEEKYIFDFGVWNIISISNNSRGSTHKDLFLKQELDYNMETHKDYRLQEIDIREFPVKYQEEFLEMIFSPDREYCFMKENDKIIPEIYNGRIVK